MKINFLIGKLIFRRRKTGVHVFHENILKEYIKRNREIPFFISAFTFFKKKYKSDPLYPFTCFKSKLVEIILYFLPIEIFFGKSDVYICDGFIPHTYYSSKKVAVVHDLMVKRYPENYKWIMKLYLYYYFYSIKRADVIIAVSETTKRDIVKYLKIELEKIYVVYNGINLNRSEIKIEKTENVLSKKYLFYIGDMRRNKNLLSAIKGFEKYIQDENDSEMSFYIAGSKKNEYDNLYDYVKKKNIEKRVKFLGYVNENEKVLLYKNAFALLFVSYYEGFGIPILEAMFYEVPIITSDCSAMKEIAGNAAVLVNPKDIQEISYAISQLNNSKTRLMYIDKGRKRVRKFTWENSYKQFYKVLQVIGMKKDCSN